MTGGRQTDETTVNDHYAVTVPAPVRNRLDIEPGDKVRWTVTDDGDLEIDVVKESRGVLEGFEPVDMGDTHAARDHDIGAVESRE